ncbi:MAG: class I SAM-dependent methyltransferase [Opitutaceae bacterium]|nr:class I SAM-dependent methyltransferase [Opitutaceae bacterium]
MGDSIYDAVPWLERSWSAMAESRERFLQGSEAWYSRNLSGIDGCVCELGCGFGRLLVPLARRGVCVHGMDASAARVAAARELFATLGSGESTFEVLRMPEVPRGRQFDAVILALNAIGYVRTFEDKVTLMRGIASILKPGGLLLMDQRRGSLLLRLVRRWPGLKGKIAQTTGANLVSGLRWDSSASGIRETFELQAADGTVQVFHDTFRFCSVSATLRMLQASGFRIERCDGGFSGGAFRPWSRTIAIVARRTHDTDPGH